jgi:hypothetical protein
MKAITIEDVLARRPCPEWTEEKLRATANAVGLKRRASARTLYRRLRGHISDADLLWLLLDESLMTPRQLRLFACDCAARALRCEARAGRKPDPRSLAAVRVARRYANGKATAEDLSAAWAAERRWQVKLLGKYIG